MCTRAAMYRTERIRRPKARVRKEGFVVLAYLLYLSLSALCAEARGVLLSLEHRASEFG